MYRLVVSDLDETLLVNHHVPVFNQEAINKIKARGVRFAPCTGRAFYMLKDINDELAVTDQDEYSICFNGGAIYRNKGPEVIYFKGIDYSIVEEMVEINQKYHFCMLIFTTEKCYLLNPTTSEITRKQTQKCPFEIIEDIQILKDKQIAKANFQSDDAQILLEIKDSIIQRFAGRGVVTLSSGRYIEVNAFGVDKGKGLQQLAEILGIKMTETMALGDNYNDIAMLQAAGLGVCMPSSREDIKEISDYVTEKDYFEGAVAEALSKFILEADDV